MTTWRARLAVIGIFLAGFVCGASLIYLQQLRLESQFFHAKEPIAQVVVYKLTRELGLRKDQQEVVRSTILDARTRMMTVRKDILPLLTEIFNQSEKRIRAVLTPEQQAKFDRIVSERRRQLQEAAAASAQSQP